MSDVDTRSPVQKNRTALPQPAQETSAPEISYQRGVGDVLMLQRAIGNRATARIMGAQKPVQSRLQRDVMRRPSIQRMISIEDYKATVPKDKGAIIRDQIIERIKDFEAFNKQYEKNFPMKASLAAIEQYRVQQEGFLRSIVDSIASQAAAYKVRVLQLKDEAAGDNERIAVLDTALQTLTRLTGEPNSVLNFIPFEQVHNGLFMRAQASNPDLNFMPIGAFDHVKSGAAQGGFNTLASANLTTGSGSNKTVKEGFIKNDPNRASDAGDASGISPKETKASLRSTATFEVSELLRLNIIPQTALVKNKDGSTGQFMEKAKGTPGQGTVIITELKADSPGYSGFYKTEFAKLLNPKSKPAEVEQAKDNIEIEVSMNYPGAKIKVAKGQVWAAQVRSAAVNWMDPTALERLNTLQWFDMIVGHADRHAGNYILQVDPHNPANVLNVKGIDNDDTFGSRINAASLQTSALNKTPLPNEISIKTAALIMMQPFNNIAKIMVRYTLSDAEILAAQDRWTFVQQEVRRVVLAGNVASTGDAAEDQHFATMLQYSVPGFDPATVLKIWGATTNPLGNDSYAGLQHQRLQHDQAQPGGAYTG